MVGAIVLGVVIVGGIIGSEREVLLEKNNDALSSYGSGGSAEDAISTFESLSNDTSLSDSDRATMLFNQAMVLASEDRKQEALTKFREALPLMEKDSATYYQTLGEIAQLEGDGATALQHLTKAVELAPTDFSALSSLATLYMDATNFPTIADFEKALIYAERAYQNADEVSKEMATDNLAVAYYMNENYTKALEYFKKTNLVTKPQNYTWIGASYTNLEQYSLAIDAYTSAKRNGATLEPDDHLLLGICYLATEQTTLARSELRLAIEQGAYIPEDIYADIYNTAYPEE